MPVPLRAGAMSTQPLDPDLQMPLHRQLRAWLSEYIVRNKLSDGDLLPSSRSLAAELRINRLTALKALQAMRRARLVGVDPGRGFVVIGSTGHEDAPYRNELQGTAISYRPHPEQAYSETVRSARESMISFAAGYPDPRQLPLKHIRRTMARWFDRFDGGDLIYHAPEGHPRLRAQLWRHLEARGIHPAPERDLLVTNGAQHAIDLFARAFPKKNPTVAMELPAFYGALAAFRVNACTVVPVFQDDAGLSVSHLAATLARQHVDLLYTNPTYNNPTGNSLTRQRRETVVKLAKQHDILVLEDDTYADLGFTRARMPSLLALDRDNRVCHIRSFSKSFMPGLRMGMIVGPRSIINRLRDMHGVNDMCSSTLSQMVLCEALSSGIFERHVKTMREIYAVRCRAMAEALAGEMPAGCRFRAPRGGFFIWVQLPDRVSCSELQRRCNSFGVDIALGPDFFGEGYGGNYIRLNFTLVDEAGIRRGVKIIASETRAIMGASPPNGATRLQRSQRHDATAADDSGTASRPVI